jgi:lipid-A-disaccharide synthase
MRPKQIMLIAGEPSGDTRAAELVHALREELTLADVQYTEDLQPLHTGLEPRFFGAGGPDMKAAGVELTSDMMDQSMTGIPGLRKYLRDRRLFNGLFQLALNRQPDVIIGVDYNYFNLKFTHAIKQYIRSRRSWFHDWQPKLVKFVSPQVWASREARVHQMAADYDLLLAIFPFEKSWYAQRVPEFQVEYVGHPLVDTFLKFSGARSQLTASNTSPQFLFLPGSREGEVKRHMPVMIETLKLIRQSIPDARARIVSPSEAIARLAKSLCPDGLFDIQVGGLLQTLAEASVCISKTGTITMECAFPGVPTVTFYKTSWINYEFAKRLVKINSLTMPNILAHEQVFPEFIQNAATAQNIAREALDLLRNESRREYIKSKLAQVVAPLGGPGASRRAAQAIVRLLKPANANARLVPSH